MRQSQFWTPIPGLRGSILQAEPHFTFCSIGRCSHVFGLLNAVQMTAGHNALRGSGPDQKLAFKNAMAQVGCPDRRIDRLCITCCSPSQPSHHAGCPARSRLPRKRDGFLVSLAPSHHGPDHSGDLVGERDSRNLGRPPRQQGREPGPMFGAMDLGVTDDSKRAGHEQAAQIAVTLFAYIAEPVLASTRVLFRHHTDPRREVAPRSEGLWIGNGCHQSSGQH